MGRGPARGQATEEDKMGTLLLSGKDVAQFINMKDMVEIVEKTLYAPTDPLESVHEIMRKIGPVCLLKEHHSGSIFAVERHCLADPDLSVSENVGSTR